MVSEPELCVCVGLSAGTMSELSYIRWNIELLEKGNLKGLIAVRELLRDGELPPEYESVLTPVLRYVETVEKLSLVLKEYQEASKI